MSDREQDRWPRGTPVGPDGKGPGGGRFRSAVGWVGMVAARLDGDPFERLRSYAERQDYRVIGQAGGSSAEVEFRQYSDGTELAVKRYGWGDSDYHADYARVEEEAARVGHAIGAPVALAVVHPSLKSTVLMEMVSGQHTTGRGGLGWDSDTRRAYAAQSESGRRLALLDALISNGDRHTGNWIVTDDGPVGIDHGYTMRRGWFDERYPTQPYNGNIGEGLSDFQHAAFNHDFGRDPRWQQTAYSRAELESLRPVIAGLPIRPHKIRGLLAMLEVIIDATPA